MKKSALNPILLFAAFCMSIHATAQNKVTVSVTIAGEVTFHIEKERYEVCISQKGKIINYTILSNGKISYDFDGRIDRIGQVPISYDFDKRIDKIDGESLSYDFDGRIEQIGSTRISYNLQHKIATIGETEITYNNQGKVESIE